jgi:O-antigen/teichoic acid export membrane protein
MAAIPHAVAGERINGQSLAIRKWLSRGALALADQALISGSNFVLGILLARWLGTAEYGVYAVAFATFLLLSLVHHALVLEPMSVFGASRYGFERKWYLGLLLWAQLVFAPVSFVLLGGLALGIRITALNSPLAPALLGIAIAAPAILMFWFARRALYLEYSPQRSAGGAVVYCAVLFASLAALHRISKLSALSAFLLMAIAAWTAAMFLILQIRPRIRDVRFGPALKSIVREHWNYGRWALASSFFIWVPWNLYYSVVCSFSGLAAAGKLRALMNLALPMTQSYAALALLVLPRTASVAERKGWLGAKREAYKIAAAFTALSSAYWIAVSTFRMPLLNLLYSGNYSDVAQFVPWLAIASIASGTIFGPLCAFRAMRSPSTVCCVYMISSLLGGAVGIPATRAFGLRGTIWGITISSLSALALAAVWLVRSCNDAHDATHVRFAESA